MAARHAKHARDPELSLQGEGAFSRDGSPERFESPETSAPSGSLPAAGAPAPDGTRGSYSVRGRMGIGYVAALFAACLAGFAGVCAYLLAVGKIPFWQTDASSLYLNSFIWEGEVLRDAFASLASGQGFSLPLYTFQLGYGADVATSLDGLINDPLNLVSAFVSPEQAVYAFEVLVFVRLFLAAVAFSFYSLRRGNSREASMVGTLAYAFCGFMLFWGVLRHPQFINMAILLPLVLAGVDDMFARGRSPLLVVALGLQFFESIYFAYMTCLILLAYCLIKYFSCPRQRGVRDFVVLVAKFVVHITIAFALAAVCAVPILLNLLSLGRVGQETLVPAVYELSYYAIKPAELIGGLMGTRGAYAGAVVVALVFVFLAARPHIERSQWRSWLLGLVLATVCGLVPYAGHVLNGFGYATDRWMLGASFVVAYICVLAVPALPKLTHRQKRAVAILGALVLLMSAASLTSAYRLGVAITMVFFVLVLFVVLRACPHMGAKASCATLCALALVGAAATSTFEMLPGVGDYADEHLSAHQATADVIAHEPILAVEDALEADGWPLARSTVPNKRLSVKNTGLNSAAMPIDFYSSYYNQPIDDFRTQLGIADHFFNYRFAGSDSRLAIDLLTGARYYVARDKEAWQVPYSYQDTGVRRDVYAVYETEHALPLAFATNAAISARDYASLTMLQRQEALLQGTVLEDADLQSAPLLQAKPVSSSQEVAFDVACEEGIVYEQGRFTVEDPDARATITFKGLPEVETYLVFSNLEFEGRMSAKESASGTGFAGRIKQAIKTLSWRKPTRCFIYLWVGENSKNFEIGTPLAVGFGGKVDWASCLGYSKQGLSSIQIAFEMPGVFTFDGLSVACQPVEPIVEQADALAKGAARDLQLQGNQASATFDAASKDSLAFFSIAYSPGWSATVDGAPARVLKADTGFVAVPLSGAGEHEVKLSYLTPGLLQGAVLSLVGCIAFIVLLHCSRQSRKLARGARKHRGRTA